MKLLEIREIKIGDNLFLGRIYNYLDEDCIEWINRTYRMIDWDRYYYNVFLKLTLLRIRRIIL